MSFLEEIELTESQKDYLTVIWRLFQADRTKLVRTKDIAHQLGVATPSVVEYLRRLENQGLVKVLPRRGIKFTENGLEVANLLINRHHLLQCLFQNVLGLEKGLSFTQASSLEHLIHPKMLKGLHLFLVDNYHCPREGCTPEACFERPECKCDFCSGQKLIKVDLESSELN